MDETNNYSLRKRHLFKDNEFMNVLYVGGT